MNAILKPLALAALAAAVLLPSSQPSFAFGKEFYCLAKANQKADQKMMGEAMHANHKKMYPKGPNNKLAKNQPTAADKQAKHEALVMHFYGKCMAAPL